MIINENYVIRNTINKESIIHISDSLYLDIRAFLMKNFESRYKRKFYLCVEWLRQWCYETNWLASYNDFKEFEKCHFNSKTVYIWECNEIGYFIFKAIVLNGTTHILIEKLTTVSPITNKRKKTKFDLLESLDINTKNKNALYEAIIRDVDKIINKHLLHWGF